MNEKFTPGPWVSEIHRINTPNEQSVGFFVRTITDKKSERRQITGYVETYNPELFKEIESDAALIAAAPEMYEFIRWIRSVQGQCAIMKWRKFLPEILDKADEILHKAEGEE